MTNIDQLIQKFKELKEHLLEKAVNESYSGEANTMVSATPSEVDVNKAEESKHDRCVKEVEEKGNVKNPHAVCIAAGVEPDKWKKSNYEKISLSKNGQWKLDKIDSKYNDAFTPYNKPNEQSIKRVHRVLPDIAGKPVKLHSISSDAHVNVKKPNTTVNKVDPEENVNIPHPKTKAKMMQDPSHNCDKCGKSPCVCRSCSKCKDKCSCDK